MKRKESCPDRCDIEFTYDWNHTNLSYNVLKSQPQYILSAGDSLSVVLKNVSPQAVYVSFDGNQLQLTDSGDNTWTGTIPSEWTSQGTFSVILKKDSCKLLLWEGLLNQTSDTTCEWKNTIYGLGDSFIQAGSEGITVSRNEDGDFIVSLKSGIVSSEE